MRFYNRRKTLWLLGFAVSAVVVDVPLPDAVTVVKEAEAIVGRPFTPGSAAGMSRRTARRTSRRTSRRHSGYGYGGVYAGTAAVGAAVVYSLPSGCVNTTIYATPYYNCAGTYYRPMYDGPDTVYVIEDPYEEHEEEEP